MRAIAALLLVTGCGVQTFAWPVDHATTVDALDAKYHEQIAQVNGSDECVKGDPLRLNYSNVSECERLQYQVFADYWRARRTLADLKGWK